MSAQQHIARMTLREKCAQMVFFEHRFGEDDPDLIGPGDGPLALRNVGHLTVEIDPVGGVSTGVFKYKFPAHGTYVLQVKLDQLKAQGKTMTPAEQQEFMQPTLDKYAEEGNAYYSTARLWDDGVIDPLDTRKVLALGISAARNAPQEETRFGVFRM